jgi:cell division protein FtsB
MSKRGRDPRLAKESMVQAIALCCLLALGGMAIVGPSGVLAWGENRRLLEVHRQEIAQLTAQRGQLQNRVRLLDPHHVDPDLAGELLRAKLNVVHPDEMVLLLH